MRTTADEHYRHQSRMVSLRSRILLEGVSSDSTKSYAAVQAHYAAIARSRLEVSFRMEAVAHRLLGSSIDTEHADLTQMYYELKDILDTGHTVEDIERAIRGD